MVVSALCVFGGVIGSPAYHCPLEFLCIPVILWAAFRLGQRETAAAVFVLAGFSTWGTLHGYGPFAGTSTNNALLLLQAYLGVVSVMSLAVAAIIAERRQHAGDARGDRAEPGIGVAAEHVIEVLEAQISERVSAEKALAASEIRFQRLLASNVIGIMTVDGEGRILEANDALLELLGYPRKALREPER